MSNKGELVASGQRGNNSDVLIWNFKSGTPKFKLSEHDYEVSCVSFSNDDRLLLSCGNFMDKKVFIWDAASGCIVASCSFPFPIQCLAWGGFVRDLKWRETNEYQFATCSGKTIHIWKLNAQIGSLEQDAQSLGSSVREFITISFTKDEEKEIIVGTKSADFFIINMKNRALAGVYSIGTLGVTSVITIDPQTVAVGCGSGDFAIYKQTGSQWVEDFKIQLGNYISGLSYNNGRLLITTDLSQVFVFDLTNKKPFLLQEGHNAAVRQLKFADGDISKFASASDDGSIRFWDMNTFLVTGSILVPKAGSPQTMQIKDDIMISGWQDGGLRMHEIGSSNQIWQLDNAHKGGITSLELTKDSKMIATGGTEGVVRIWELRSLAMKTNLKEHTNKITKVKLWPGDQKLISASRDKSLLYWDQVKEKRLQAFYQTMGGVNSFDIIPEQNLIVSTGQDRKISYWDLRVPNVVKCFDTDPNAQINEECHKIRCSKDGKSFYTGGSTIRAWDLSSGKCQAQQLGHSNGCVSLDLSANEKSLITGGMDASIIIWQLN